MVEVNNQQYQYLQVGPTSTRTQFLLNSQFVLKESSKSSRIEELRKGREYLEGVDGLSSDRTAEIGMSIVSSP